MSNAYARLSEIQRTLKAPKNQFNGFGKYNYRSCEDILESLKPHLVGCAVTITDGIINLPTPMVIVEAIARFHCDGETIECRAQAGIDPNRKGMDIAQSFGSSSSYARKYALQGLFLLDDTKDADSTNTHGKEEKPRDVKPEPTQTILDQYAEEIVTFDKAEGGDIEAMKQEMAKWCSVTEGGMDKFSKITKGHFKNPLDIGSAKNVEVAYKLWKKATINQG